jgi:hypothetical protein
VAVKAYRVVATKSDKQVIVGAFALRKTAETVAAQMVSGGFRFSAGGDLRAESYDTVSVEIVQVDVL